MHKETRRLFRYLMDRGVTGWIGNNGVLSMTLDTLDARNLTVKIDGSGGFEVFISRVTEEGFASDPILVDKYRSVAEKGLQAHQHKKDVDLVKRLYGLAEGDANVTYARLISHIVD